jgi:hypothetical protein
MEEFTLLTDWRFLLLVATLLLVIGEGRYKLRRHEKLLDEKTLANASRDTATMAAELKSLIEDQRETKTAMARLSEKHDLNTSRLWTSLEDSKERLSRLEGKLNSG